MSTVNWVEINILNIKNLIKSMLNNLFTKKQLGIFKENAKFLC